MNQLNFEYLNEDSEVLCDEEQKQEYLKETISEIIQNQPLLMEIEVQQGNFDLLVLCDPDVNRHDSGGYTILHHAISYSRVDVVKYLLKKGANPNLKSKLQQSCLMMACSFGSAELVKLFLNLGGNINEQDQFAFTPLIYAFKGKHKLIAIYLISLGADLKVIDHQGCTLRHWAAYTNDIYLLQLIQNQDLPLQDNNLLSPIERALKTCSFEAVKYLLTHFPASVPKDLQYSVVEYLVKQNYYNKILNSINKPYLRLILQIALYSLLLLDLIINPSIQQLHTEKLGQNLILIFLITSIFSFVYTLWFMKYTTSNQKQGISIFERLGHPKIHFSCNHEKEQKLEEEQQVLKKEETSIYEQQIDIGQSQSIYLLDQVKEYFEMEDFSNIFDLSQTCPICLKIQQKREFHCEICNECVPGFQFHSTLFKKCINDTNHFFYFLQILNYYIVMCQYLYLNYYGAYDQRSQFSLLLPIEILYILRNSQFSQLLVLSLSIIVCMLFQILIINIYGIIVNRTYNEIMNPEKYKYLYRHVVFKDFHYYQLDGMKNLVDTCQEYIWNSFQQLRILT